MTAPSARRRVGVLALQGDVREHARSLREAGAEPVEVRRPEHLEGLHGIVLPGGESTTIGKLLGLVGLLEPLRASVASGLPTYGSCAGLVLLSKQLVDGRPDQPVLGALDVVVRRNAFGSQVESFESDLDVAGIDGGPVHGVFIRAPWVESAGSDVEVLATVPDGAPAAGRVVAVRQGRVLATSFHPELTGDARVHSMFVKMVEEADR